MSVLVLHMPAEVREGRLPEYFPAFMAAHAAPDGRLWVRRWPPTGRAVTLFDVFEADGTFRTTVVLPYEIAVAPTPVLTLEAVTAVGIDRETGANTVLRFERRG